MNQLMKRKIDAGKLRVVLKAWGMALFVAWLCTTGQAWAQCSDHTEMPADFGVLTHPADAPIGTVLAERTYASVIHCSSQSVYSTVSARRNAGYPGIFSNEIWHTNIAGLGIRMYHRSSGRVLSHSDLTARVFGQVPPFGSFSYEVVFQLIKIGRLESGSVQKVPLLDVVLNREGANGVQLATRLYFSSQIIAPTCRVSQPTHKVVLPDIRTNELSAVGATAGDTNFSIGLQCSGDAKLHVTLTDALDPDNRTSELTLAPASGVKLRILNANGPVVFGADSSTAGNPGSWFVGIAEDVKSIPLTAQYIRTGDIKAGRANGLATFTLSYQ